MLLKHFQIFHIVFTIHLSLSQMDENVDFLYPPAQGDNNNQLSSGQSYADGDVVQVSWHQARSVDELAPEFTLNLVCNGMVKPPPSDLLKNEFHQTEPSSGLPASSGLAVSSPPSTQAENFAVNFTIATGSAEDCYFEYLASSSVDTVRFNIGPEAQSPRYWDSVESNSSDIYPGIVPSNSEGGTIAVPIIASSTAHPGSTSTSTMMSSQSASPLGFSQSLPPAPTATAMVTTSFPPIYLTSDTDQYASSLEQSGCLGSLEASCWSSLNISAWLPSWMMHSFPCALNSTCGNFFELDHHFPWCSGSSRWPADSRLLISGI